MLNLRVLCYQPSPQIVIKGTCLSHLLSFSWITELLEDDVFCINIVLCFWFVFKISLHLLIVLSASKTLELEKMPGMSSAGLHTEANLSLHDNGVHPPGYLPKTMLACSLFAFSFRGPSFPLAILHNILYISSRSA